MYKENKDGKERYVYLLDEEIGLEKEGCYSELMKEMIVEESCKKSYREAAKIISQLTGQTISHTAVWEVVQQVEEKINQKEEKEKQQARENKSEGKLEVKMLFEEQDGVYLKMQGESRKKYGKTRETKVEIAYEGAKKTGKERLRLTNKVACANFETVKQFVERKEGVFCSMYNMDEVEIRVLNGDGAEWIKESLRDENMYFQLDPFHRNQAIMDHVKDKEKRNT